MDLKEAKITPIQLEGVHEISSWEYPSPYDIYNLSNDEDTIQQILKSNYFIVQLEGHTIGYFCCKEEAQIPYGSVYDAYKEEGYLDIGVGLNPKYIGQGLGKSFMELSMDYLKKQFKTNYFRLTVLDNNLRARRLYHRLGFKPLRQFPANKPDEQFIVMVFQL